MHVCRWCVCVCICLFMNVCGWVYISMYNVRMCLFFFQFACVCVSYQPTWSHDYCLAKHCCQESLTESFIFVRVFLLYVQWPCYCWYMTRNSYSSRFLASAQKHSKRNTQRTTLKQNMHTPEITEIVNVKIPAISDFKIYIIHFAKHLSSLLIQYGVATLKLINQISETVLRFLWQTKQSTCNIMSHEFCLVFITLLLC